MGRLAETRLDRFLMSRDSSYILLTATFTDRSHRRCYFIIPD